LKTDFPNWDINYSINDIFEEFAKHSL